jgi:hypothetical protein
MASRRARRRDGAACLQHQRPDERHGPGEKRQDSIHGTGIPSAQAGRRFPDPPPRLAAGQRRGLGCRPCRRTCLPPHWPAAASRLRQARGPRQSLDAFALHQIADTAGSPAGRARLADQRMQDADLGGNPSRCGSKRRAKARGDANTGAILLIGLGKPQAGTGGAVLSGAKPSARLPRIVRTAHQLGGRRGRCLCSGAAMGNQTLIT